MCSATPGAASATASVAAEPTRSLRTDYELHEKVYRRARLRPGREGWNTPEQQALSRQTLDALIGWPEFPTRGRLLELGCGAGQQGLRLAGLGFAVSGVDIAPTAIEWAREHAAVAGIDADYRVGNVLTLDGFDDESFDVVLDASCLHCIIGADRPKVLAAARRVLCSAGTFIVRTMCDPSPENPPPNFDFATHCCVTRGFATRYIGLAASILDELKAAGFEVVRADVTGEPGGTNADLEAIALKR